jgi:hypothetical protein
MKNAAQLEKDILSLPPVERAHVALAAWESLEDDPAFAADRTLDPEGVAIALQRDQQIESGVAKPLTHGKFIQRTGGAKK